MSLKEMFYCLLFLLSNIDAANILAVFPMKLRSHYLMLDTIVTELVSRGHNVTVVSPFSKPSTSNLTVIDVSECITLNDESFTVDKMRNRKNPFRTMHAMLGYDRGYREILSCESMKRFLNSSTKFHLQIIHFYNNNIMLGMKKKVQTPHIFISVGPLMPWCTEIIGNPDNPSYIPYPHTDISWDHLKPTFYQRLYNILCYISAKLLFYYYLFTKEQRIVKEHFDVNYSQMQNYVKDTSLTLAFSHFSINSVRPLTQNVIEVGGLHITKVSPLPKDIEKFINESEHGVIYFSMGSLLKSETMPEEKRNAFLYAFSKIPQRILWKWGNDTLPGKTDNILISKWFPQRDILAHPNVKLFLSHGGALGVNEAVYEGVPILGIPMYADQTLNLRSLEWQGAAEALEYTDISKETVLSKIKLMLNDNKYSENMKRLSAIYRDRPMSPMDTAIYWIEYVIRHKGAPHLRSAAVDLPLYQYLLLDVIAFCLLILIMLILVVYYCFKMFVKFACRSKPKINSKKKN